VGTHYPGDVLGGALLGIGVALALYLIPYTRRLLEAVAGWCGALWDRLLLKVPRFAPSR
jgi:membrane-associated phospholipid phosphatase